MDSLKKLGAALSAHYEKLILSAILLALLGTAALLPLRVSRNQETIRQAMESGIRARKKEASPVDVSAHERVLRRVQLEPHLSLDGDHNLFNPVTWRPGSDGTLFKVVRGDEDGPGGLSATAIRPLDFTVEFDGVQRSGDSLRYRFLVLDQSKGGRTTRPRQVYLSEGVSSRNDPFVLTKVNGPAEEPASVEIRFADSTETATITPDNPYRRVAGYEADLVHDKLGNRFSNVRARQPGGIRLGSQTYIVVAITHDTVTVQSSTHKRWNIRLKGTP